MRWKLEKLDENLNYRTRSGKSDVPMRFNCATQRLWINLHRLWSFFINLLHLPCNFSSRWNNTQIYIFGELYSIDESYRDQLTFLYRTKVPHSTLYVIDQLIHFNQMYSSFPILWNDKVVKTTACLTFKYSVHAIIKSIIFGNTCEISTDRCNTAVPF